MGTSSNVTSFPIISGIGGYFTIPYAASLKPSNNCTLEQYSIVDTSAGAGKYIIQNPANFFMKTDPTTSGQIDAYVPVTSTQNQTTQNSGLNLSSGTGYEAAGQYISYASYPWDSVSSIQWFLDKTLLPTGTAYCRVRQASDNSILGTIGTLDVSTLTGSYAYTTFTTTIPINVSSDFIITLEYTGGDGSNYITIGDNTADVIANEHAVYSVTLASWVDWSPRDQTFQNLTYQSMGATYVSVTGVSTYTLHDYKFNSDSSHSWLTVDGLSSSNVTAITVPSNTENWTIGGTAVPLISYYDHTVGGTLQAKYQPTIMPTGTALPDATGNGHTGTIVWGANSNLVVTYGSVITAPTVQTVSAIPTPLTANLYGSIISLGSNNNVNVGFRYGQDTTYGLESPLFNAVSIGGFAETISGLMPNTLYHYQAELIYGNNVHVYGMDATFTTSYAPGSSTTLEIRSAKMFSNYSVTGDLLLTLEEVNNYTNLYPNQNPTSHFTIQLLGTDNSTILAATPLQQWRDRPSSIYLNPTVVTDNITIGSAYYIKMIGDSISGYATVEYQLVPNTPANSDNNDWMGSDLTKLDSWVISTAENMGMVDGSSLTYYITNPTNTRTVVNDLGGGFFNIGIPGIVTIRQNLFSTAQYNTPVNTGVSNNVWDSPTAWMTYLGASITSDVTVMALPFGLSGKDFMSSVIIAVVAGCVMIVIGGTGGFGALGAVLISVPIVWLGTWFRILPVAGIVCMVIIFAMFAIRQFVIKTL